MQASFDHLGMEKESKDEQLRFACGGRLAFVVGVYLQMIMTEKQRMKHAVHIS